MDDRQYNRAVRVHKYVYEALMRLAWRGFSSWLENKYPDKVTMMTEVMEHVSEFHEDI